MVSAPFLTYYRYSDDYKFSSKNQDLNKTKEVNNIKKVEVYLGQDDNPIQSLGARHAHSIEYQRDSSSRSNRFEKKKVINLKYFTSNLSEIPGPVTDTMSKMKDIRKNSSVNQRYDNNMRKLLYHSSYRIVILFFNNLGRKHKPNGSSTHPWQLPEANKT